MKKINDLFDKVFVVNLPDRVDRLDKITNKLSNFGINFEVFEAFDGRNITENFVYENEKIGEPYFGGLWHYKCQIGCFISHYEILKICKDRKYEKVLVLEDDCDFVDNFDEKFLDVFSNLPSDWDFFYLSCSLPTFVEKFEGFAKTSTAYTTHSYIVNKKTINFLLTYLKPLVFKKEIDKSFSELHNSSMQTYVALPFLTYQSDGHSDIQNTFVDYTSIKKYI